MNGPLGGAYFAQYGTALIAVAAPPAAVRSGQIIVAPWQSRRQVRGNAYIVLPAAHVAAAGDVLAPVWGSLATAIDVPYIAATGQQGFAGVLRMGIAEPVAALGAEMAFVGKLAVAPLGEIVTKAAGWQEDEQELLSAAATAAAKWWDL